MVQKYINNIETQRIKHLNVSYLCGRYWLTSDFVEGAYKIFEIKHLKRSYSKTSKLVEDKNWNK